MSRRRMMLATMGGAVASAPVFWRPSSTLFKTGSWTPDQVHTRINEVTPDDGTDSYTIQASAKLQIRFTGPAWPGAPTSAQLSIRVGGYGTATTATVYIAGPNFTNLGSIAVPASFSTTILTIPASVIATLDPSNIYFELNFNNYSYVTISWAEIKFLFQ